MKKFYVECGEKDWIIVADDAILKEGCLFFFENSILVAMFNSNSWDVVRLYEE